MNFITRNRFTITGGTAGLAVWSICVAFNLHPMNMIAAALSSMSSYSTLDEGLIALFLLLAGRAADITKRYYSNKRDLSIDEEKLRTMHATVRSIEDSVFNTYNGFQLLITEARARGVSEEVLSAMETSISRSVSKIRSFHEAQEVCEKGLSSGMTYIDPHCRG